MQWNKWSAFFCEQIEALFNETEGGVTSLLSPKSLEWGNDLWKLEQAHSEEIEAAIFTFMETRKWPAMSRPAKILLEERLLFACGLAEQTQFMAKHWKMGPATVRHARSETIKWFLVDAWEEIGFDEMVSHVRLIPHPTKRKIEAVFGNN